MTLTMYFFLSNKALNILIAQLKQQKLKHTCYKKMLPLAQIHCYYSKLIYRCTYNAKPSKNVSKTLAVSAVLFCMIPQMRPATDVHGCGIHAQHLHPKNTKLEVLLLTRPDELCIILPMFIAQTLICIGYLKA